MNTELVRQAHKAIAAITSSGGNSGYDAGDGDGDGDGKAYQDQHQEQEMAQALGIVERALTELEQEVARLTDRRVWKVETLDDMGRIVREIWVRFAQARAAAPGQPAKPSQLVGWDNLDEPCREAERQIGHKLFSFAFERGFRAGVLAEREEHEHPRVG